MQSGMDLLSTLSYEDDVSEGRSENLEFWSSLYMEVIVYKNRCHVPRIVKLV